MKTDTAEQSVLFSKTLFVFGFLINGVENQV